MFGPIYKGIGLAASPKGRRALRMAIVLAQTEQGRAAEIKRARSFATGPEGEAAAPR